MNRLSMAAMLVLGLAGLAGCDSAGDASCAICAESFTDQQCDQLAKSHGCSSGEAYQDTVCQPPTQGCNFHGCPDNVDPCDIESGGQDAGAD